MQSFAVTTITCIPARGSDEFGQVALDLVDSGCSIAAAVKSVYVVFCDGVNKMFHDWFLSCGLHPGHKGCGQRPPAVRRWWVFVRLA